MESRASLLLASLLALTPVALTAQTLPTPLSACVDRALDTKNECLRKKRFDEATCKVHYEQSLKICYDRYK